METESMLVLHFFKKKNRLQFQNGQLHSNSTHLEAKLSLEMEAASDALKLHQQVAHLQYLFGQFRDFIIFDCDYPLRI